MISFVPAEEGLLIIGGELGEGLLEFSIGWGLGWLGLAFLVLPIFVLVVLLVAGGDSPLALLDEEGVGILLVVVLGVFVLLGQLALALVGFPLHANHGDHCLDVVSSYHL